LIGDSKGHGQATKVIFKACQTIESSLSYKRRADALSAIKMQQVLISFTLAYEEILPSAKIAGVSSLLSKTGAPTPFLSMPFCCEVLSEN
jgi:hypothetical protein